MCTLFTKTIRHIN